MRVKITYSVDFDEIPLIVSRKLLDASNKLDDLKNEITPDSHSLDNLKKLETIDAVRRKMAVLDSQLEDCYAILAGYNKALADMKLPPEQEGKNE